MNNNEKLKKMMGKMILIILIIAIGIGFTFGMVFAMVSIFILIPFCFTYYIIYSKKIDKKYKEDLKTKEIPTKVRYIDTFFYDIVYGSLDDRTVETIAYHIFKNESNKKLYAFYKSDTNIKLDKFLKNTKAFIKKNHKKIEININDEANMWIDNNETNNDIYSKINNQIVLNGNKVTYIKDNKKLLKAQCELYNLNKEYDDKLLDDVIFSNGYVEIDKTN